MAVSATIADFACRCRLSSVTPLVGLVGADGENQHWIDEINGNIKKGRPGVRLKTVPDFCAQVPKTYNKVTDGRLLGSPLLACTLDWKSYLDGAMNEIGGITSGLGRSNIQKNAEPHCFYLFKNKHGRVAFHYKTKHDVILDNDWQGASDTSDTCLVFCCVCVTSPRCCGRWR